MFHDKLKPNLWDYIWVIQIYKFIVSITLIDLTSDIGKHLYISSKNKKHRNVSETCDLRILTKTPFFGSYNSVQDHSVHFVKSCLRVVNDRTVPTVCQFGEKFLLLKVRLNLLIFTGCYFWHGLLDRPPKSTTVLVLFYEL